MKNGKKKIALIMIVVLSILVFTPLNTQAASLKSFKLDRYMNLGNNYMVLVYNHRPGTNIKVYKRKNIRASAFATRLNYGGAVVVNTKRLALRKGGRVQWVPVYINSGRRKLNGYVRADQIKIAKLNTKRYSRNATIHRAIRIGMRYLGTPFVMPGSSLSSGIDCAQFVAQVYRKAGKRGLGTHTNYLQAASRQVFYHRTNNRLSKRELNRMKPGDLLFYLQNDTSGPVDHVGIYIGNGFMLNSSGHYGSTYPNGGVCIKRVQYGSRNIVRCMRLRGL